MLTETKFENTYPVYLANLLLSRTLVFYLTWLIFPDQLLEAHWLEYLHRYYYFCALKAG